jgi:hypothetical protein
VLPCPISSRSSCSPPPMRTRGPSPGSRGIPLQELGLLSLPLVPRPWHLRLLRQPPLGELPISLSGGHYCIAF